MIFTLRQLYQVLDSTERKTLLRVFVVLFLIGIFEIFGIASIIPIISIMNDPEILNENEYLSFFKQFVETLGFHGSREILVMLGITSFTIIAFSTMLRSYGIYVTTTFIELRRHKISYKLFSGYLGNDFEFFVNAQTSELTKIILSEVDRIVAQLIRPIITMISYVFLLIFILGFLLVVNPKVSLTIIFVFGGLYAFLYLLVRKKVNALGEQTVNANKARFAIAMEAIKNIKFIKFSGLESYYSDRFARVSHRFSNSVALQFVLNQIPKHIVELLAFGGIILICIVTLLTTKNANGKVPSEFFPLLGIYALSAYKLQPAVQAIFNGFVSLRYGRVALDNLFASLNQITPVAHSEIENLDFEYKQMLQSINLSFCYSGENQNIFENLNFKIKKGSTIGIVGNTGSGKSTFVNLLLGLLRPTGGKLIVDGNEINNSNMKNWQELVGYVPQDVSLIDASVHENIAFGVKMDDIDLEFAEYCARVAMIDESFLKNKNDNTIGDDGSKISGGQKQRIGIARALYKKPELLVLDEATSALDPNTEKLVLNAISKFSKNLSIIMITHRYNNLGICDEVYEMVDGNLTRWSHIDK